MSSSFSRKITFSPPFSSGAGHDNFKGTRPDRHNPPEAGKGGIGYARLGTGYVRLGMIQEDKKKLGWLYFEQLFRQLKHTPALTHHHIFSDLSVHREEDLYK